MRAVCVHGHFYQPPRENPWTGGVDQEPSAAPLSDWNERITDECYRRNTAARILDAEGRIVELVNTFSRISFNVGPTLMAWLERHAPDVHDAVVAADREGRDRTGHGPAMAQPYVHAILPLAEPRDRATLVRWGIRDFERRFGRRPEGMWLPETAVDLASLDLLAAEGMRFTILAPRQVRRARRLGARTWTRVADGAVDARRPYVVALPSGRTISVYVYDGATSQAVAFEGLLESGDRLADHLLAAAGPDPSAGPQPGRGPEPGGAPTAKEEALRLPLGHVVTDGESYGHHHAFGEMALAWALRRLERTPGVVVTTYARHLAECPPTDELDVVERSSWSCEHGVERWRSDCGCSTGYRPEWHQAWRRPLRDALDWLRDALRDPWERAAAPLLGDPWAARDDYADVAATAGQPARVAWLARWVPGADDDQRVRALRLAEVQRHLLEMFTSCAWFFDDAAGIEPVQSLRHAARAVDLARLALDVDLEHALLDRLHGYASNDPSEGDALRIWSRRVRAHAVDARSAAFAAAAAHLLGVEESSNGLGHTVSRLDGTVVAHGDDRLALGRADVEEDATTVRASVAYALVESGGWVWGGVAGADDVSTSIGTELAHAFGAGGTEAARPAFRAGFEGALVGLEDLPPPVRAAVADAAITASLRRLEDAGREAGDRVAELGRMMWSAGALVPRPLQLVAELALDADLRRELRGPDPEPAAVAELLERAAALGLSLDHLAVERPVARAVRGLVAAWWGPPRPGRGGGAATSLEGTGRGVDGAGTVGEGGDQGPPGPDALRLLTTLARRAPVLRGWGTDLGWYVQNAVVVVRDRWSVPVGRQAVRGDPRAGVWTESFRELCAVAGVVPEPPG